MNKQSMRDAGRTLLVALVGGILALAGFTGYNAWANHIAGASATAAHIPYQGRLELSGQAVDGQTDFKFRLYSAKQPVDNDSNGTDDNLVWTSGGRSLQVSDGYFAAVLGDTTSVADGGPGDPEITESVLARDQLFVGIEVDGQKLAGRQRIMAVPYANRAAPSHKFFISELHSYGDAKIEGDTNIDGVATVSGDLTVGENATVDKSLAVGGNGGYGVTVGIDFTDGIYGLNFFDNPEGGNGDDAWVSYRHLRGIEGMALEMGIANDYNDVLRFVQDGQTALEIGAGSVKASRNLIATDGVEAGGTSYVQDLYVGGELHGWPAGSYCIMQNGGSCPSEFNRDLMGFDLDTGGDTSFDCNGGGGYEKAGASRCYTGSDKVILHFCCK